MDILDILAAGGVDCWKCDGIWHRIKKTRYADMHQFGAPSDNLWGYLMKLWETGVGCYRLTNFCFQFWKVVTSCHIIFLKSPGRGRSKSLPSNMISLCNHMISYCVIRKYIYTIYIHMKDPAYEIILLNFLVCIICRSSSWGCHFVRVRQGTTRGKNIWYVQRVLVRIKNNIRSIIPKL